MRNRLVECRGENWVRILWPGALTAQTTELNYRDLLLGMAIGSET